MTEHVEESLKRSEERRLADRVVWSVAMGLIALVAVVWSPAIFAGMVFDDYLLVDGPTCYRDLANVPGFFYPPNNGCDYRPMRFVTYALDYALAGRVDTRVFHTTNLLFHLGAVWMAWWIMARVAGWRALTGQRQRVAVLLGAGVLLLYAVHPVQADAVVPLAGRRDVQSTFLSLAALAAWMRREEGGRVWAWVGLSVSLWVAAMLTKEMAITLPALIVLVELFKVGGEGARARLKALWSRTWPVWLLIGALLVVAMLMLAVFNSFNNMAGRWWGGSPVNNALNVLMLQGEYARLIFWPARLVGDYALFTVPLLDGASDPRLFLGVGVVLSALLLAALCVKRAPRVSFGVLWFAVSLSPVSHVFPHHELMAEHFLHLPLLGVAWVIYGVAESWLGLAEERVEGVREGSGAALKRRAWILAALLAVLTSAAVVRTEARIGDYSDAETFNEHVFKVAPDNLRNLGRSGAYYLEPEHLDVSLAERFAWMEWRLATVGSLYHRVAAVRLSVIYDEHYNDPERAEVILVEAFEGHANAMLAAPLARLWLRQGRSAQALELVRATLSLRGGRARYRRPLEWLHAQSLLAAGQVEEAGAVLESSAQRWGWTSEALYLKALWHLERGQPREAFGSLEALLAKDPEHVGALQISADMLCALGRQEAALSRARQAAALDEQAPGVQALLSKVSSGCP